VCLAQTGLGSVHGLASPLGAFFPIAHGVVCGTLVAAATRVNVEVMRVREPRNAALAKYAEAGRSLSGRAGADEHADREALVDVLEGWTARMALPRLSTLGVTAADVERIVAHSRGSSMKTNPVVLTDAEVRRVVEARL
jgi:alcohol dehydrogenase